MTQNQLVSVVIPVYNSEKYLEKCLDSILEQTYQDIEIIAIDDESNDSSLEILKNYSSKIKMFSQKNQGLAESLTHGISKIQGHWFKWFSPDDEMYQDAIEILVKEAQSQPNNTILYSDWNIIDDNGELIREFHETDYNNLSDFDYSVRLLDGQQINVNTTLIPTQILRNCSMRNLDDPVAIDYDFFLRAALLHNTKFHLIPKPLVKYRIHSEQLSHKNISNTLEYIQQVKDEILHQIDQSLKSKFISELTNYQKTKPMTKKTMEFGMKLLSSTPSWASDRILTLYLNKIRRGR